MYDGLFMSNYALSLEYQLTPGWLKPYTDGLNQGRAVAWCCTACQRTSFPPIRTCACGQITGNWVTLSGYAVVIHYTFGQDGEFALARFDGADTSSVVKLCFAGEALNDHQQAIPGTRISGSLQASISATPELVLQIEPVGEIT